MSIESNKQTARRLFESVWNDGNTAVIDEIIDAEQFLDHHYMFPEPLKGTETFKGIVAAFRSALPDVSLSIEDVMAEDDRVFLRWSMSGTQKGELLGAPPSNKTIRLTGMIVVRFDQNGRIVERWVNEDALGLMKQLGIIK